MSLKDSLSICTFHYSLFFQSKDKQESIIYGSKTERVRYNYYSIDFACVSIEFITKSQCMDGKWIAFGHSEGSSYFYSRGYLKYLMVEYRLFPVFIIKIRICVQIVNTGIFAKLKDKGYLNTAPAVL